MDKLSLHDYLTLLLCPGLGAASVSKLVTRHTLKAILTAQIEELNDVQRRYFKHPPEAIIGRYCETLMQKNIHWLGLFDNGYPNLLKEISTPPLMLFYQGDKTLLNTPQLAIVGTRNPSVTGRELAYSLASESAIAGLTITSGLALGIDTAAHQGALSVGKPTIAVLGTGLDVVYPKRNAGLFAQIKEQGLIISEFLPGTVAKPEHFPRRNRVVSGLSLGTLVVEAEIKSGSLITAKYALEQNREVFAVPSSVHNPMAKGCHFLIKQGAKLCECSEDILTEFPLFAKNSLYVKEEHSTQPVEDCPVLNCLGYEATSVDTLQQRTQWPIETLMARLLDLELEDKIAKVQEGYMKVARG